MKSKKIAIILGAVLVVTIVIGTFTVLYFNRDQNKVPSSNAYTLPSARVFKVDPFPVPASGIYTSEKNGDWDFASNKDEGWIKVRNNAASTRKIGWQIDCRPDQPGGAGCWDNDVNPKGELTVAPGEAWEVLVGKLCLPYQLDFTGPDFGRYIPADTSLCNRTASPTPTRTASPTASPTHSPSASPTVSPSGSPTRSPSPSPTRSSSPTATATSTASSTASPSPSPTTTPPIGGPSDSPTPTASPTPTPTSTPSSSSTSTPAPSATPTPVAGASSTPQPSDRAVANATSTLPEAGISNGVLFIMIASVSLLLSGVFALLKKKYY